MMNVLMHMMTFLHNTNKQGNVSAMVALAWATKLCNQKNENVDDHTHYELTEPSTKHTEASMVDMLGETAGKHGDAIYNKLT